MSRPMAPHVDCVDSLAADWLRWSEGGSRDRRAVEEMLADPAQREELRRILAHRVAFGTAGIRARMGPG